jgi:hypothetical protein
MKRPVEWVIMEKMGLRRNLYWYYSIHYRSFKDQKRTQARFVSRTLLTAVVMKSSVFCYIVPSSLLEVSQHFRGRFACFMTISRLTSTSALKMTATCSSETLIDYQWTADCYIPENRSFRCIRLDRVYIYSLSDALKSTNLMFVFV